IYIWEDDYRLIQVSFVPAADIPAQRQRVTVAVTGSHDMLDMAIAEFNRHNAYYEAEVVDYDYFEGCQKLETELATGKAPDLLDTQLCYMDKLVEKGLLADISPYLEDGRGIERQDLVEAVLRCNTIDGVLTCIPESFGLEVLVGKPQLLGDEPGWTLAEYMSCIQENAGLEVMGSNRFSDDSNQSGHAILDLPMYGDITHWADYRQGEAHFDREDFLALLELAGSYEVTQPAVDLHAREELQAGRMLTYVTALYKMEDYLLLNEIMQQEIVYKGYPAEDGNPVYSLVGREGFAINAHSQVRDGAWALIEFLLTYQFSDQLSEERSKVFTVQCFSVLESQFDYQMAQSAVKEYQRNSNFDLVYDETGKPIEKAKYTWYDTNGSVKAECPAATPEDVESLRMLIDMASQPSDTSNNNLFQILYEETSAYLEDQRGAQETADIIQSRVQLFLDENK
ncbi:MAG: extracellular solute-binding protein, partial [Acetatifactor sp.]|nr:extracellular solute-binding protein [Acetatifactor sp.]